MVNCIDFEEENTLLQSKVLEMCDSDGHLFFDHTPKCHCQLDGEGIDYTWGFANNYYLGLKKAKNKGKYNFINSSSESISREFLTTACCRKFSLHSIQYIWYLKKVHIKANDNA